MIVKRLVRPEPTTVLTDDGYLYEWPNGGEAVDVLEHHRKSLLATKGAHLVEVEVTDQPVLLPAVVPVVPLELATLSAPKRTKDADLTGAKIDPSTVPAVAQASEPQTPEPLPSVLSMTDPATVAAPTRTPDPVLTPVTGHRWSAEDLARLEG